MHTIEDRRTIDERHTVDERHVIGEQPLGDELQMVDKHMNEERVRSSIGTRSTSGLQSMSRLRSKSGYGLGSEDGRRAAYNRGAETVEERRRSRSGDGRGVAYGNPVVSFMSVQYASKPQFLQQSMLLSSQELGVISTVIWSFLLYLNDACGQLLLMCFSLVEAVINYSIATLEFAIQIETSYVHSRIVSCKPHDNIRHWKLNVVHTRDFSLPSAIQSQMDLLWRRYDDLAHELSHNDGSFSSDKITALSIEMAELEPKVTVVRELQNQQNAAKELDEMIAEQAESR
ncbi:unnamed protein product [Peronospora belbahrii]|uniref:SMODS and SLOG-associating 2TM effector domain-containing protein n=1 Tax=Peronospora belbahrii TaxID=622444 RepID=A0AAU9KIQ0_9STRA|nr:unnamed protein product [Peronospora belbahrii]